MEKPKTIFEDKYLIVVEKPAGILSYPLPGSDEKTVGDLVGAQPVHRLDRDTSGILILAKSEDAKAKMQALFKSRQITKKYTALVWGKVEPETGEINIPLGRGRNDRLRVVPKAGGRESVTEYQVEKYFPKSDMSLLSVNLKTGRTHQIRVHMSAIGHPVVGDPKYSKKGTDLARQFLHSSYTSFIHPITGEKIELKSALPADLKIFLKNQA